MVNYPHTSRAVTQGLPIPAFIQGALVAHGDPDDHLRLCALMADHLWPLVENTSLAKHRTTCLNPTIRWAQKLEALTELLHELPLNRLERSLALLDIDALFTDSVHIATRWDDAYFKAARAEFFQMLIGAIARGGWQLIRPAPLQLVSELLADTGITVSHYIASATADGKHDDFRSLRTIPPAIAPLLRWLLERKILDKTAAEDITDSVRSSDEFSAHVTFLVYDSLRPSLRRLAIRLATLRAPQALNGHYGPFPIRESQLSQNDILPEAFSALVACGLIQHFASEQPLYHMPRAVRRALASHGESLSAPIVLAEHRQLSREPQDPANVEASIEIHHHAIKAEDAPRAVETALFYVSDLRRLALALSLQSRWGDAADVYKAIVRIDTQDAYAWEYLGYNLARYGTYLDSPEQEKLICDAYTHAARLEPRNPLFAGRLLGFRAERHENVFPDFGRRLLEFYELYGDDGVSYFAEAVIKGFERAERFRDLEELRNRWKPILLRSARVSARLDRR